MALKVNVQMEEKVVIPEGIYEALVTGFEEYTQFNRYTNKAETGVRLIFTLTDTSVAGYRAYMFVTPNLSPKSKMNLLCLAIRKKKFTMSELKGIITIDDVKPYVFNMPLRLVITHRTSSSGKLYYSISAFMQSLKVYDPNQVIPELKAAESITPVIPKPPIMSSEIEIEEEPKQPQEIRQDQRIQEMLANPTPPNVHDNHFPSPLADFTPAIPDAKPQ